MTSAIPQTIQLRGHLRDAPIGVLDSGLGGLSIVQALQTALPAERILYYADSAWCPYGDRDEAFIRERTLTIASDLEAQGVKALVIACNTACAAALHDVRRHTQLPVIGLEPAVKPAVELTRTGRIAVFATPRTIASQRLASLIDRYARRCVVDLVPAPDWVGLVEHDRVGSPEAEIAIGRLVRPAVERGADVLVLGCTHYPFLIDQIERVAGTGVAIVDSGAAIARRTRQVLEERHSLAGHAGPGPGFTMLTSAVDPGPVVQQAASMLRFALA